MPVQQVDTWSDPDLRSQPGVTTVRAPSVPWEMGAGDLFFTTNPGLEDIVVAEFAESCQAAGLPAGVAVTAPFGLAGHVLVRHPEAQSVVLPLAMRLRSIHHLLRPVAGFGVPAGDELAAIRARLLSEPLPDLVGAPSFRVTTRRVGRHDFTSMDVERVAGAALVEHYGRPVNLERPAVHVRVDLFGGFCLLSLQVTDRALSQRHHRIYQSRAALKATVAYALLRLAGLRPDAEGAVLDPCCGSGTLLLEAAHLSGRLRVHGCDIHADAVAGARANLEAAGCLAQCQVRQLDLRCLDQVFAAGSFRAVVANPPYGVKVGQTLHFPSFYRALLEQSWRVLEPDGRLVVMVWRRGVFVRAVNHFGRFRLQHLRAVEAGGLFPHVFVLHRPATEPLASDLAGT